MLRRLMETGAVMRPGRGRPRLRPAAVAGGKGYSLAMVKLAAIVLLWLD